MFVDIGYIDQYNSSTGQGRISHTIAQGAPTADFAIFHKEQVHQNELIDRLNKNSYRGVRIWYRFYSQENSDQVTELWLSTGEMDQDTKREYAAVLEKVWVDIEQDKPHWLDSVTKSIGGPDLHSLCIQKRKDLEEEKERLIRQAKQRENSRKAEIALEREKLRKKAEQREAARKAEESLRLQREALEHERIRGEEERQRLSAIELDLQAQAEKRSREIQEFCRKRNIKTLVHFTRVENLNSILKYGLLSRAELESMSVDLKPLFNDQFRVDGLKDGICLSISYPNYRMFFKLTQGKYGNWVVILADASVLWKLDCAFNCENAASRAMQVIPLLKRKEYDQLVRMFSDCSRTPRQQLHIPDYYTTDPQAEVLVFERIPKDYIQAIHFFDPRVMAAWRGQNPGLWQDTFRYELTFSRSRADYEVWKAPAPTVNEEVPFDDNFLFPPEPFHEF